MDHVPIECVALGLIIYSFLKHYLLFIYDVSFERISYYSYVVLGCIIIVVIVGIYKAQSEKISIS